jgi:hypothetical protein
MGVIEQLASCEGSLTRPGFPLPRRVIRHRCANTAVADQNDSEIALSLEDSE